VRLYDNSSSGNAYKVRLLLALLGVECERVEMDIDAGATRTPRFLAMNPNGRIPLLELDDGRHLAESNAILCYLADGTPWLPVERWARAKALQWMFFEQYSHEPYIAVSRYILTHLAADSPRRAELERLAPRGVAALEVMDRHLATADWFAGDAHSVADIALYAYTHVAGEGGFDLAPHRHVRAWLARCAARPGHVPIDGG